MNTRRNSKAGSRAKRAVAIVAIVCAAMGAGARKQDAVIETTAPQTVAGSK